VLEQVGFHSLDEYVMFKCFSVPLYIHFKRENHLPIDSDPYGRWNDCHIKIHNFKWNARVCYTPATARSRKEWMQSDLQSNKLEDLDILVGDFNCTIKNNQHISSRPSDSTTHHIGREELIKYTKDLSLIHAYDTNKLTTKKWTFSSPTHRSVLDHLFLSPNIAHYVTKVEVLPGPTQYEHDIVLVTLNLPKNPSKFGKDVKRLKHWIWNRNCKPAIQHLLESTPSNLQEWLSWKKKAFQDLRDFEQRCIQIRRERKKQLKFFLTALKNSPFKDQAIAEAKRLSQEDIEDKCVLAGIDKRLHSEIPSRYLTRKLKARQAAAFIHEMHIPNENKTIKTKEEIENHFKKFFANIFAKRNHSGPNLETLLSNWKIDNIHTKQLADPITEEEVLSTIKNLKKSKAPGIDGLPSEFYHLFSRELSPILTSLFNQILIQEIPIPSPIKSSIIRTIPKGNKNPNVVDNRRPISLLNLDYKIFTKILNQRLLPIVNQIVLQTQNGFLPKRNITDNIIIMEECILKLKSKAAHDCEEIKKELRIISPPNLTFQEEQNILKDLSQYWNSQSITLIDFAKAFDSISHQAIEKILEHIGCPPLFTSAIMNCLSNTSAQVIVNGFLTKPFKIERGAKQGDTISPTLFILVIELFNQAIHKDPSINGISIGNLSIKGLFFADDAVIIAISDSDLTKIWDWLQFFCEATTMEISLRKCIGIKIGNRAYSSDKFNFLHVSTKPERYLGIWVSKAGISTSKNLINDSISNLEGWKQKSLTHKTRTTVLNTYLYTKWWYQIRLARPNSNQFKQLNNLTTWFFWNSSNKFNPNTKYRNTRSLTLLHNKKENGGLELNDPEIKYLALKIKLFLDSTKNPQSLTAIAWRNRIRPFLNNNNTWFVSFARQKPYNRHKYALFDCAQALTKVYTKSNNILNYIIHPNHDLTLKDIYWEIYSIFYPEDPFTVSQKEWMNVSKFDLTESFNALHSTKAIPNATNFLWKYLHRCLPGMFP